MTSPDADLKGTARAWWIWGFVFLFLLHVGLVFWLGDRWRPRPFGSRPEPFLFVITDEEAQRRLSSQSLFANPTLFALPSELGFSGGAWLSYVPQGQQSSNWVDMPRALPLPVAELGSTFLVFAATNRVLDVALLDTLRAFTPLDLERPSDPIATASTVAVRGLLQSRTLHIGQPLPSAPHTELLTNTVVEVQVNGDGTVESTTLLGECGLKMMDEKAMEWARTVRFSPLPLRAPEREMTIPTRGRLVFTWHIAPLAATNAVAAKAE